MDDRSFDLRRKAFVQGAKPPPLERCSGAADEAHLLRRVSDRVVLWAELECSGLTVLSDTYYPGWEATLDGRPVPILEVYSSLRGIVTPKGKHRIEMRYRPWSVYLGFALTLAGLAVAAVASQVDR